MATTERELNELFERDLAGGEFRPYFERSTEADALSVYFKPDPDYSKRLTDHVTLFLSVETSEIVGCRIKGITGILEDLPNYIRIDHDGVQLKCIFWSFRGSVQDESQRRALNELAKNAGDMVLEPA
jgi:hypothetical protein